MGVVHVVSLPVPAVPSRLPRPIGGRNGKMRSGLAGLYRSKPSGLYCSWFSLLLSRAGASEVVEAADGNDPGRSREGLPMWMGAEKVPKCELKGP